MTDKGHPLREDVSWNINAEQLNVKAISSSSWGCELKCITGMRMTGDVLSSSSWGCELKYYLLLSDFSMSGHPLREDVSWNITEMKILRKLLLSPSSWGCELKCPYGRVCFHAYTVILFVRMWVEINSTSIEFNQNIVILFVRMWVEMMLDTVVLVQVAVILLVKMWVEILKSTVLIIVVAIWFFLWGGELKYPW